MTLAKEFPHPVSLQDALYHLVHRTPGYDPKRLAEIINKSYPTLINAAGADENARFDAHWLMNLTRITRNFSALDVIERECGRVAVEVPVKIHEGDALQAEALRVAKEMGEACDAIRKALDPKGPKGEEITRDEKARIRKETYELLQEAARLWKLAEGL